jgi:hypothetical protein
MLSSIARAESEPVMKSLSQISIVEHLTSIFLTNIKKKTSQREKTKDRLDVPTGNPLLILELEYNYRTKTCEHQPKCLNLTHYTHLMQQWYHQGCIGLY